MRRRLASVGRDVGRILEVLGVLALASLAVPLLFREWYAVPGLLISGLAPLAIGRALAWRYEAAPDPGKLHGMMTAAGGWLLVALFGALPYLAVAWTVRWNPAGLGAAAGNPTLAAFRRPSVALFESMSGFTCTGLTMALDEGALPRTFHWWRSLSEWVGGVGVIVLTTAILARPGSGSLTLYRSEARSRKIHPSIVSTVRTIWWVFILLTLVATAWLWSFGMPLWDSLNHAMTGLATGGFSVTDHSIAEYGSPAIEAATVPVMVVGSIAFPVHYLVLRGNLDRIWRDLQTRSVLLFFGAGSLVLTAVLLRQGIHDRLEVALRYGVFQFVSAASTTGFQTDPAFGAGWTPLATLAVGLPMIVGGAAGSTSAGLKIIRALTLLKGLRYRFAGLFYPASAVRPFRMGERALSPDQARAEFEEAAIVSLLWVLVYVGGVVVLLLVLPVEAGGLPLSHVLFEAASAQGNVGISTGITAPSLPLAAKLAFVVQMWIGRLEIIPVVVFLRALLGGREVGR